VAVETRFSEADADTVLSEKEWDGKVGKTADALRKVAVTPVAVQTILVFLLMRPVRKGVPRFSKHPELPLVVLVSDRRSTLALFGPTLSSRPEFYARKYFDLGAAAVAEAELEEKKA